MPIGESEGAVPLIERPVREEGSTVRTAIVLPVLITVVSGMALGEGPVPVAGVLGGDEIAPNREICWSEPPNFDDDPLSSEVIDEYGLDSEVANDFLIGFETGITLARWWGGYTAYHPGDPLVNGFNLRFYEDGPCIPQGLLSEIIVPHDCNQTHVGEGHGGPTYEYFAGEEDGVCCPVGEGQRVWFGAQTADHPFPPQWGRCAAYEVTGCDAVFKAEYFSFPDWTPAVDVIGTPYDASQEFECGDCGGVAVEAASWGRIKGLYR